MKAFIQFFTISCFAIALASCGGAQGEAAETGEATDAANASTSAVTYNVDPASSIVLWTGYKIAEQHNGSLTLKDGSISVKDGNIEAGSFTIDMNSLTVLDLPAGDGKEDLEGHLKGSAKDNQDHFFNVAKFPTAKFEVTEVAPIANDSLMTHSINGNLSMKDTTINIGFKANVSITEAGVVAESNGFSIDRTQWGVHYGSSTIFPSIGDRAIKDNIDLKINLVATSK